MRRAARLPEVVPDFAAIERVEGPHVVGRGDVQNAVHLQDGAFDGAAGEFPRADAADDRRRNAAPRSRQHTRHPRKREVLHARRVDVLQVAVPPAGVVAGECRPGFAQRLHDRRRIETTPVPVRLLGSALVLVLSAITTTESTANTEKNNRGFAWFEFIGLISDSLDMPLRRECLCRCRPGRRSLCASSGSRTSTFGTSAVRRNDRGVPSACVRETMKSSMRSSRPTTFSPFGSVTTTVASRRVVMGAGLGLRARGATLRHHAAAPRRRSTDSGVAPAQIARADALQIAGGGMAARALRSEILLSCGGIADEDLQFDGRSRRRRTLPRREREDAVDVRGRRLHIVWRETGRRQRVLCASREGRARAARRCDRSASPPSEAGSARHARRREDRDRDSSGTRCRKSRARAR